MTPGEYRTKAMWHVERARADRNAAAKDEHLRLALGYMRLAEMSEKNRTADLVYEPPLDMPRAPAQKNLRPQEQQQPQQRLVEPSEE